MLLTTGNPPPEVLPTVEEFHQEELGPVAHHELVVVPTSKHLVVVPASRHYVMFDAPKAFFGARPVPGDRGSG